MSVADFINSCLTLTSGTKVEVPIFFLSETYGGTATNDDLLEDIKIRICSINNRKEFYGMKHNNALVLLQDDNQWTIIKI